MNLIILLLKTNLIMAPFLGGVLHFSGQGGAATGWRVHKLFPWLFGFMLIFQAFLPAFSLFSLPMELPVAEKFTLLIPVPGVPGVSPASVQEPGGFDLSFFFFLLPGTLWFLGELIRQKLMERRVIREAESCRCLGGCRIIYSKSIKLPFSSGIGEKRIFLPFSLDPVAHKVIIAHEACHLRRGDLLWTLGEKFFARLFFWNPLLYLYARRGEELRELLCDERISRQVGAETYALCLLETAEKAAGIKAPELSAGMEGKGFLARRVEALVLGRRKRKLSGLPVAAFFLSLLGFTLFPGSGVMALEPEVSLPVPETPADTALVLRWPLEEGTGRITQKFGPSIHPFTRKNYFHQGVDIAWGTGVPVLAAARGTVKETAFDSQKGYLVILQIQGGHELHYYHLGKLLVKAGELVNPGDRIGLMGSTGLSTGPHVHFGVFQGDQSLNPLDFFTDGPG